MNPAAKKKTSDQKPDTLHVVEKVDQSGEHRPMPEELKEQYAKSKQEIEELLVRQDAIIKQIGSLQEQAQDIGVAIIAARGFITAMDKTYHE